MSTQHAARTVPGAETHYVSAPRDVTFSEERALELATEIEARWHACGWPHAMCEARSRKLHVASNSSTPRRYWYIATNFINGLPPTEPRALPPDDAPTARR